MFKNLLNLFNPSLTEGQKDRIEWLIEQMPPIAKSDLMNDLHVSGFRYDADLLEALEIAYSCRQDNDCDGEELYALVQQEVDSKYGVKR